MQRLFIGISLLLLIPFVVAAEVNMDDLTADATRIVYANPPATQEPAPLVEEETNKETLLLEEENQAVLEDEEERERGEEIINLYQEDEEEGMQVILESTIERFLVQFKKDCDLSGIPPLAIRKQITTDHYEFMILLMPRALLPTLVDDDCTLMVADSEHQEEFFAKAEELLAAEALARALELELDKSSTGVSGYEDVTEVLTLAWDTASGEHSVLQNFVTPADVVAEKKLEDIYEEASSWLWISDEALFGQEEHWLTPAEFLTQTPNSDSNPLAGRPASDCSEQANTLASMLRASGVSPRHIRVAMGSVQFHDDSIGGHAWVELRQSGTWIVLDSTVGAFYDDETGELADREGLPVDYWNYHPYPVIEVWAYYNDQYFLDLRNEHAPSFWSEEAGTLFDKELREAMEPSVIERALLFLYRVLGFILGIIQ
jgi:hypothetical protein